MTPPSGVLVELCARTDVGRTRDHNEDSFVVADLATAEPMDVESNGVLTHWSGERGSLFMVADGMGGAAAGELASAMAVTVVLKELRERWLGAESADEQTFVTALKRATEAANADIHRFAGENPEYRGMGTTATIAGFLRSKLYVAQVGDSRAYLVRDGVIRQITKDQTLIQRLIEAGELTPEEGEKSERRNIILQALGPDPVIKIDLTHQQVRRGDTLILCSDGLSGLVKPLEIEQVARETTQLDELCNRLIGRANDAGGPDNITVIAVRFNGGELHAAAPEDVVEYRKFQDSLPDIPAITAASPPPPPPPSPPPAPSFFDNAVSDDLFAQAPPLPAAPVAPASSSPAVSDPSRRKRGNIYLAVIAAVGVLIALALIWRLLRR